MSARIEKEKEEYYKQLEYAQKGVPVSVRLIAKITFQLEENQVLNITGNIGENNPNGIVSYHGPPMTYTYKNILDFNQAITKLRWVGRDLEIIPAGIGKYKLLALLDLENNKIERLPDELFELKKLKELYLASNKISVLTEKISHLKLLKILSLSNNQIKEIPITIAKLKKLKGLDLGYNKLEKFPFAVLSLEKLETLILSGNSITQIPGEISSMKALKKVYLKDCPLDAKAISNLQISRPDVVFIF